jgi:hypothetical protein
MLQHLLLVRSAKHVILDAWYESRSLISFECIERDNYMKSSPPPPQKQISKSEEIGRFLLSNGHESEEYFGRDVLFLFAIQAAADSMNEKWRFCNADDAACMKAHLRIDFLYDRVRSIWLGCSPGFKGTKAINLSKTEAMHIPARSILTDPSASEDYDVGDNGSFFSFYDSIPGFSCAVCVLRRRS